MKQDVLYVIGKRTLALCCLLFAITALGGCALLLKAGGDGRFDGAAQPSSQSLDFMDEDDAFAATNGEIRRTGNEPGQSSNRHYMKSFDADFLNGNWTCQIVFHAPENAPDDIIFIGLGEGVPDGSFFNEPRNGVNFRIHQGMTAFGVGWRVDVVAHDAGAFHWTYSVFGGALPGAAGGTHTVRIRKIGPRAIFEIIEAGITVTIPDIAKAAPFLSTQSGRLFFGNASSAYTFDPPLLFQEP
jgi:hypothetical protein